MKNKRLLAILAIAAAASFLLSACNITGDKPEEQVIVADDAEPTPEPTKEPEPTEEPEPVWEPVYTSEDGSISINLPNETWSNKTDENGIISFESEQGKIVIVHGEGDDLDTLVLPDSEDMAATLVRAKEIEDEEFEIAGTPAGNILVIHGHNEDVGFSLESAYHLARREGCGMVCFGHTHRARLEESHGVLFLNPGSTRRPRDMSKGSAAVITADERGFSAGILYL